MKLCIKSPPSLNVAKKAQESVQETTMMQFKQGFVAYSKNAKDAENMYEYDENGKQTDHDWGQKTNDTLYFDLYYCNYLEMADQTFANMPVNERNQIMSVKCDMDRGITDMHAFGQKLLGYFPNVRTLDIKQNYSYDSDETQPLQILSEQIIEAESDLFSENLAQLHLADRFLLFLQASKWHRFWFDDSQSSFVRYLTNDLIFEYMPENAFYIFRFHICSDIKIPIISEQRGTKTLVVWEKGIDLRLCPFSIPKTSDKITTTKPTMSQYDEGFISKKESTTDELTYFGFGSKTKNTLYFDDLFYSGYIEDADESFDNMPVDERHQIIAIKFDYIDRGISDMHEFGKQLLTYFPNVRTLDIEQNYSHNSEEAQPLRILSESILNGEPKSCVKKDLCLADRFLLFLQASKLHRFWFDDFQSSFVRYLTNDLIFSFMPEDAFYIFCFNINRNVGISLASEQRGTKTLVVRTVQPM